jgi:replicative DNA helicase
MITDYRHLEEVLIGTLIANIEYRDLIFSITDANHFPNLHPIYLEACKQHVDGVKFNEDTLSAKLQYYNGSYLLELQLHQRTSEEDIKSYAKVLKEISDKKRLTNSIRIVNEVAHKEETTMDDLIMHIDKLTQELDEASPTVAMTPTEILERESSQPKKEKIITGIKKVDDVLYKDVGLHKGDINIVLADSGHGKTQWSTFLGANLAMQGYQGLWFQMEDYDVNTAKQLGIMAGYHADNVRIIDSIDDIDEIKRMCRLIKIEHGLDFVVIDYIQEVYAQGRFDSRTLEIQYVTKILKQIAKDLNVVVIVPSQVTINEFNRSGWSLAPKYKDAQWAQAIKNVAHCMTSVFRPNMIQSLVTRDHDGFLAVKGRKDGETHDYQSVFLKLVKTRRGQLSHDYIHLLHERDMGLSIAPSKI